MRFANDFHSWLRHSWKLLANRLTRDPKIAIHGNSCIILYIKHTEDWSIQFYFLDAFYLQASKLCGSYMIPFVMSSRQWSHGPLVRYVKLWIAHAPGGRERFPGHRWLAIPTCITARAWRTCRDACRDPKLAVFVFWANRWWGKRSRHFRCIRNP